MNNIPWLWIFVAVCFILRLFQNKIIGFFGELWVKRELKKLNKEYRVINDVMIKTEDGKTHQIDHIVISRYGIFVIETKQLNAYITGNDYNKKWLYKTKKKTHYINNPVHQNYGHIQALKEILNIEQNKFISIVCITSNAKIKIDSTKVVFVDKLLEKIKSYNIKIIDNKEEIYNKIKSSNITNKIERKHHIKNAKKYKKQKEIENKNKCPWCGAYLIGKNGKNGPFTGCSNYPRCRFVKK